MHILLSWSGKDTDPETLSESHELISGPQMQYLSLPNVASQFDLHIVFATPTTRVDGESLRARLSTSFVKLKQEVRVVDLANPVDYADIRRCLTAEIHALRERWFGETLRFTVLLTSGTPQMRLSWMVLVATGVLEARLIQTVPLETAKAFGVQPWFEVDVAEALALDQLRSSTTVPRSRVRALDMAEAVFFGEGRAVKALRSQVDQFAASKSPLVVEGEAGSGEREVARAVAMAYARGRAVREFSVRDPDALEAFKQANRVAEARNALVLFDIEAVSDPWSGALHALLSRSDGPRLICTTTVDLAECVDDGEFDPTLHRALSGLRIEVPPLRTRKGDSVALARRFAAELAVEIEDEVLRAFENYAWPGNLRELVDECERLRLMRPSPIRLKDLNKEIRNGAVNDAAVTRKTLRLQVKAFEKRVILETLDACGGNQSEAARRLGVDRNSMRKRLRAIMQMQLGDE